MAKIVLVTGGFDPLHSGHIAYFKAAKELGDKLVVGINSDEWLARKKGQPFMPWQERSTIVENLEMVDQVIAFEDNDGTAVNAIRRVQTLYPFDEIIFANGGDRTSANIPEMSVKDVIFKFGVGGQDKANSSSWILEEWKFPKTERPWGYWRLLYEVPSCKVKEMVVLPGQSLSMQRHQHRAEYWFVAEGRATVYWDFGSSRLDKHQSEIIHLGEWHRLVNETEETLRIIEIQYGSNCDESDIQRR